ncbi:hypothetical protein USDA257_c59740 [Sinorhizobium fredii USDA 257]|jgi:hypothetical protein|uniref:Uncharacterized protein n=2 Tax=Sinorhizobium/Ensifer group TaxID=227292 RepID=I3XF22_SINF2|nr:hypothetical protein USDA257_c59740 [Sinorhizobium fredii USDA 257]
MSLPQTARHAVERRALQVDGALAEFGFFIEIARADSFAFTGKLGLWLHALFGRVAACALKLLELGLECRDLALDRLLLGLVWKAPPPSERFAPRSLKQCSTMKWSSMS